MKNYQDFLETKSQLSENHGFDPLWMPDFLFDFQRSLVEWALQKGRAAIMAGTGMGKTPMQLTWAENVHRKTNGPVLIITPLAVSHQTAREAEKFGIQCKRATDGKTEKGITVTNYERLHHFDARDYAGVVCDESSIIKNFDGKRKGQITEFMREIQYRLLCTATPAPNDYIELGTSSEALGELGYMDMLGMFFKNDQNSLHPTSGRGRFERGVIFQGNKWRFKKHAERNFWRWVCSWARAIRKPSDLNENFDDKRFELPELIERETIIKREKPLDGFLFTLPAVGLKEQRAERRSTIQERCEMVAEKVYEHGDGSIVWCHLNDEADLCEKLIPGSRQVCGSQSDDEKEEILGDFSAGKLKTLVVKPKIACHGMNWQHCNHMTFFPSHSFEQYFQGIRRCYRYGQLKPVTVEIITSEGESGVLANLRRKAAAAEKMFDMLAEEMTRAIHVNRRTSTFDAALEIPEWNVSHKKSENSTQSTMETVAKS